MSSSPRSVIGYANPDGSGRGNWSVPEDGLLARVVAHTAARIDEQVEAGDVDGASRSLRDHPREVRDHILRALTALQQDARRKA
jgi:hypothetical protein